MTPLFLGSHPALDFLNSAFAPHGAAVETIADGPSLVGWLVAAGLLTEDEAARLSSVIGAAALDRIAAEARNLREAARGWVADWQAGRDMAAAHAALDAVLRHGPFVWRLTPGGTPVARPLLDRPAGLPALIARQIALLFADEDPALVRACAGSGCTLVFLDRTKAHRRRFCSAAVCGNRAKVAAYRQRQLTGGQGPDAERRR